MDPYLKGINTNIEKYKRHIKGDKV